MKTFKEFTFDSLHCLRYVLGPLDVNTYLVYDNDTKDAIIVDPAWYSDSLLGEISSRQVNLKGIFLTHGHCDHIVDIDTFRKNFNLNVHISAEDSKMLEDATLNLSFFIGQEAIFSPAEKLLKSGDKFSVGKNEFEAVLVPGHTPGGMIFVFEKFILSGDTIFAGGIGRSDFPGGNHKQLVNAIKKNILNSERDKTLFPGHGPESTIQTEKLSNPFLDG
ncbi:MAG: MBL fold metallo-hydrolase [Candidatus Riflebacteria bacterium]|nr:MBL fold metallo-hydrolase [Candidatus Riflebacteria bacterium]